MSAHPLSLPPERVGKLLHALITRQMRPVFLNGQPMSHGATSAACAPDGFLPAFMVAAESLWHALTGTGFGMVLKPSEQTSTGVELTAIRADSLVVVLLCLLEVLERLSLEHDHISLNDLPTVWDYGLRLIQVSGERAVREEAA
ncbi:hypothetical protein [Acetobacter conturbans]|uniref:Uncharacterized protein n=1 Tax=Acetobacter conturbans TaxID=1737472 RepID=A0ABX0K2S1_9PROT|nr:hypothetical protein [Acetobacter conturbans]NHN89978.1 hypothetical protein [Acetobacter conturbans]